MLSRAKAVCNLFRGAKTFHNFCSPARVPALRLFARKNWKLLPFSSASLREGGQYTHTHKHTHYFFISLAISLPLSLSHNHTNTKQKRAHTHAYISKKVLSFCIEKDLLVSFMSFLLCSHLYVWKISGNFFFLDGKILEIVHAHRHTHYFFISFAISLPFSLSHNHTNTKTPRGHRDCSCAIVYESANSHVKVDASPEWNQKVVVVVVVD